MTLQLQFIIVPIMALIVLAVGIVLLARYYKTRKVDFESRGQTYYTKDGLAVVGWIVSVVGAIATLATLIMLVPFSPTYWTYNHVEGAIVSVSNRFVQGTGDLSSDYVLRIAGHPGVYNVQDDRIQGVKIGDKVDLTCTVEWVYAGQDQNNCFIRSWGEGS